MQWAYGCYSLRVYISRLLSHVPAVLLDRTLREKYNIFSKLLVAGQKQQDCVFFEIILLTNLLLSIPTLSKPLTNRKLNNSSGISSLYRNLSRAPHVVNCRVQIKRDLRRQKSHPQKDHPSFPCHQPKATLEKK